MENILIIDDDTYICNLLTNFLGQNGYNAQSTISGNSGKSILKQGKIDLVLCDYRLPDSDGLQMLKHIQSNNYGIPVIIMTAYADVKMAVKLIKSGASDYITKPLQPEEILQIIDKALKKEKHKSNNLKVGQNFVVGKSKAFNEIMQHIELVAPTELTILVEGETGTGKEYIARIIHQKSSRKDKPFIAVDCGAMPKEIANSELFGHVKGAFTGAIRNKKGYFEQAKGGTLFLDEISNLPHENQAKLLRAIQERVINKVGDEKNIKVDVRLIAATNDGLINQVSESQFREDLYHRLNEFKISLPPLRERKEDIPEFIDFFIYKANNSFNKKVKALNEDAFNLLLNYNWFGNIRELENVVNRSVLLCQEETIGVEVLPDDIRFGNRFSTNHSVPGSGQKVNITELKVATELTEKQVIINALSKAGNNKSKAAKLLNIDRKTLYNKIKLYEIDVN